MFPLSLAGSVLVGFAQGGPEPDPWKIDFRYQPPEWQTSICLPDDWQKTLVDRSGGLLYDYPGPHAGFTTRISAGINGDPKWLGQSLLSPRVPIVQTRRETDAFEIAEEAFAVAPPIPAARKQAPELSFEKVGSFGGQTGWASPPPEADAAFRDIAVGFNSSVGYRFAARKGERYSVVFGLCEGWHTNAAKRILDLKLEGQTVRTVDLIAEKGRNVPAAFVFTARDEDGDGWIEASVGAAAAATDKNTILNLLWVFREGEAPKPADLVRGQSPKQPLLRVECGGQVQGMNPPRHDLLVVRMRNRSSVEATADPTLTIESTQPILTGADRRHVFIGAATSIRLPEEFERVEKVGARKATVHLRSRALAAGQTLTLAYGVARGGGASAIPRSAAHARSLRRQSVGYWEKADLPYGAIQVPDAGVQALLDSSARNIYQAREIKKGLPAFQVGPTCYRGLWVVDGSFILEAVSFLGRLDEARAGIQYLLSFQREDGGFMLMDGHWKETGIVLWAVARHARLTGDPAWLRQVWPKFVRGFEFIRKMRGMVPAGAPNAGLIPDGFSDGGLADRVPEYTNIYWTLAGMRAAIEAARWLREDGIANAWEKEYDDFYQAFRRAAERDTRADARGNRYVPIRMAKGEGIPPQKAQWAFCHAVFPGKVFAAADPLLQGNMAMLRAVECQGLVLDTGWLKDGIWNYFASFYGHAWLWLGDGRKASETLHHFGNHASPLLVWREEQMPVGKGSAVVGDMPHNWASAEFIRLTRNCLALERDADLHLFEGMPACWVKPGCVTRLRGVATEFGPLTLELAVTRDGAAATLKLTPPSRTPPRRIVLHLDNWSGQQGTIEVSGSGVITRQIPLKR